MPTIKLTAERFKEEIFDYTTEKRLEIQRIATSDHRFLC